MTKDQLWPQWFVTTQLNSTQQDITDVGADTSYVRIYMSN